jgi:hypothetical protein
MENNNQLQKEEQVKVKIKSITFLWSESSVIKDNTTVNTFKEAESIINRIAARKDSGGYDKTKFMLTWEDDQTYTGRIDVLSRDSHKQTPLKEHIENHCLYFAGERKAIHKTVEEYESTLKAYGVGEKEKEEYKDFIDTYMLEDETEQEKPTPEEAEPTDNNSESNEAPQNKATYTLNHDKNGIEISFPDKPDQQVLEALKAHSFRWHRVKKVWYAKQSEDRITLAQQLTGQQEGNNSNNMNELDVLTEDQKEWIENKLNQSNVKPLNLYYNESAGHIILESINTELIEEQGEKPFYFTVSTGGRVDGSGYNKDMSEYKLLKAYSSNTSEPQAQTEAYNYPEIDINDIDSYTVSEQLQKREHDSNWIFRKNEQDRTKEIQDHFLYYNNEVLDILKDTDNQTITYYLKRALQSYKKNYHNNFIKQLENRANSPSWAVTGRAGRNQRAAEKANNRYDKLIEESIYITDKFKKAMNRAKNDIRKDKQNTIREQIENNLNNTKEEIEFQTVSKEIEGYSRKVRMYTHGKYAICKNWGMFRVYKDGKEIETILNTTSTLKDAKAYLSMLVQQEQKEQEKELQTV